MPDIKCDIIIPVWNECELLRRCIASIEKNTSLSYRIILVDNASYPETALYLKGLSESNKNRTILIRNEENLGFPKAVNQGIEFSSAAYLCVLNSDTEVYKGWLEEMIGIAESNVAIGIVNPSSNNLGQSESLKNSSGKWIEMSSCIGFCMLIKREVIQKIGRFDEIYSPGNFEDTDFSRRAIMTGYRCVMAKGAYVYHVQNTGFKKRKDWDKNFKRNLGIFNKKWGKIKRIAYIIKDTGEGRLKNIENDIKGFLKNGNWVHIFIKKGSTNLFLAEHCSMRVIEFGEFMFDIKVLWNIIFRKKKFDKIIRY